MKETLAKQFNILVSVADNVYRTKHFIVTQTIKVQDDDEEDTVIYSHDRFFERTPERDALFDDMFCNHINKNGRRIRVDMSIRTYIE